VNISQIAGLQTPIAAVNFYLMVLVTLKAVQVPYRKLEKDKIRRWFGDVDT
jgi:hypothetical protein